MYLLSALAAGFVRGIYIDRLDKLSEGIGGQFREGAVPLYPLNELLYILCLLFLFMDLLLQTLDLGFEVFLFLGVVLAHHRKAFIIQPTGNIVLINADEQTVKLSDSLLSLCQPLLMQPQRFFALHTELLLHFRTKIGLVASDYRYDLLNVLPDDLFQHNSTDIMSAALILVGTMGGADKEVLPLFKIAGGGVVELLLAVIAEHQAGKHIALSRCRSVMPLLPVISCESGEKILSAILQYPDVFLSIETSKGLYSNRDIPVWEPVIWDKFPTLPENIILYKILASSQQKPLYEGIETTLTDDVYHTIANNDLIQIMSNEATKWNGIKQMLSHFGVSPSAAVYFGDDNDDIEPIKNCGLGVAVSNAIPSVLDVADRVIDSNDMDGVAKFIEENLL